MNPQSWEKQLQDKRAGITSFGVTPFEEMKRRSGLEFLRDIAAGVLPQPPIGKTLNFYMMDFDEGRAVFLGAPTFDSSNPIGTIHGGWAATLLDSCMACAIHTTLRRGFGYATVELKVNLVRPVTEQTGPVRAEGKVIHVGRRIGTSEGRLVGEDGKLYAHGTTTCMIFEL